MASMDDLFDSGSSELMERVAKARARAIELAVEKAALGKCGVLVNDIRCFATPHPSVPYGKIHFLSGLEDSDVMGWLQDAKARVA